MALTYYIRSWDPRSTYPTNPQEGDICYTITLDQTWAPVGGVKKDNIVKEEVYQNGAWVEQGGGGGEVVLPIVTVNIGSMTYTCTTPYDDLVSLIENSPYQAENASSMFPNDPPILPICADYLGEERAYGYAWSFNMPGYVSGICAYLISDSVQTIFLYADGSISPTPKQG